MLSDRNRATRTNKIKLIKELRELTSKISKDTLYQDIGDGPTVEPKVIDLREAKEFVEKVMTYGATCEPDRLPCNKRSVLDRLHDSDTSFYLTGSRYFGVNDWDSDYDYFTLHSLETQAYLEALGFSPASTTVYGDSNCISVMKYHGFDGIRIDIQLVRDVGLKDKAQRIMKQHGATRPTKAMWNLAFAFLNN